MLKKNKKNLFKKFIIISSITTFGNDMAIGNFKTIDSNKPTPTNANDGSKLEADLKIQKLQLYNLIFLF